MLSVTSAHEMPESSAEENVKHRNRSIRLAVITSFVSKFGTIFLQLVSMPIAARVLGREELGLYTVVNSALATMSLLEVGVGPALTHGLSKARAAGDELKQRELGSTAFFLMMGISLFAGLIFASVLLTVPLPTLFGNSFAGKEGALRPALWAGLAMFLMLFILNLTLRIREGHLEVAANNLWGAVGNVIGALAVGIGIWYVPEVWFLVVALYGAKVLANGFNSISLVGKHPLMMPNLKYFRPALAKHLVSDGTAFSTCCLITGYVETSYCAWLIGRASGPAEVAIFGIFMTLTVMQLGFVVMLTTPTWPAVAEALARHDHAWARTAAKRLYLFGGCFALCSAAGLVLLGPYLLPLWLGKDFANVSRGLLGCYGLYFIAHVWRHLNHTMMIGTGQVGKLVRIQLIESVFIAILGAIALHFRGLEGLLATMGTLVLLMTGTVLPSRVIRALKG